jgi:hypothetical protein
MFLALVVALLVVRAGPAEAGGSNWAADRASYAPGDTALLVAAVAWSHNATLGTPDDGPFGVWLAPQTDPLSEHIEPTPGSTYVGDIELDVVDAPIGPHIASVRFVVPNLPDGQYEILHCNVPCTTTLGDITFGRLRIGPVPADAGPTGVTPTTAAPPTTTTTAPATTTTTAVSPLVAETGTTGWDRISQVGLGIGGGLVLAMAVWLGWGRRQPTTKPA